MTEADGSIIKECNSVIDDVIVIPRRALSFISSASADELRVLLYLCSCGGIINLEAAEKELRINANTIDAALHYWRGAKVITLPQESTEEKVDYSKKTMPKVNTLQTYEPKLLAEKVELDDKFSMLVDYVAVKFEKGVLNKNDINSLYYLYDYINIPAELICGFVEYCVENNRKSMNYLVKTSISMFEEQEIDTYEKLENYLNSRRTYNDFIIKFKRLVGIGERALITDEKKMLSVWFEERSLQFELIEFAYELMIQAISKYSLKYMSAILERWYTEGITTLAAAKENIKKYKDRSSNFDNKTFDMKEFFDAALNRN